MSLDEECGTIILMMDTDVDKMNEDLIMISEQAYHKMKKEAKDLDNEIEKLKNKVKQASINGYIEKIMINFFRNNIYRSSLQSKMTE